MPPASVRGLVALQDIVGVSEFGLSSRFFYLQGRAVFFHPNVLRRSSDGKFHRRVVFIGLDGVLYICDGNGTGKRVLPLSSVSSLIEDRGADVALVADSCVYLRFEQSSDRSLPSLRQFVGIVKAFIPNVSITKGVEKGIMSLNLNLDKPPGFTHPAKLAILEPPADYSSEALALGMTLQQYQRMLQGNDREDGKSRDGGASSSVRSKRGGGTAADVTSVPSTQGEDSDADNDDSASAMSHPSRSETNQPPEYSRRAQALVDATNYPTVLLPSQGNAASALAATGLPDVQRRGRRRTKEPALDAAATLDSTGVTYRDATLDEVIDTSPERTKKEKRAVPVVDIPAVESRSGSDDSEPDAVAAELRAIQPEFNSPPLAFDWSDNEAVDTDEEDVDWKLEDTLAPSTREALKGNATGLYAQIDVKLLDASVKCDGASQDLADAVWLTENGPELRELKTLYDEAVLIHKRAERLLRYRAPHESLPPIREVPNDAKAPVLAAFWREAPDIVDQEVKQLDKLAILYGREPPPTPPPPPTPSPPPTPLPPLEPVVAARLRWRIRNLYAFYAPEVLEGLSHLMTVHANDEANWLLDTVRELGPEPYPFELEEVQKARDEAAKQLQQQRPQDAEPLELADVSDALVSRAPSFRERIVSLYDRYCPEKVNTVDALLQKNNVVFPDPHGEPRLLIPESELRAFQEKRGANYAPVLTSSTKEKEAIPRTAEMSTQWEDDPAAFLPPPVEASPPPSQPSGEVDKLVMAPFTRRYTLAARAICRKLLLSLEAKYGEEQLPILYAAMIADEETTHHEHYLSLVAAIYRGHCPEKLPQAETILERFEGREEDLLAALRVKYGIPPPAHDDLDDEIFPQGAPGEDPHARKEVDALLGDIYQDDFDEIMRNHSSKYHEEQRRLRKRAEYRERRMAPRPKIPLPPPPRNHAVVNEFLRAILDEADDVATAVETDATQVLAPAVESLEGQVREAKADLQRRAEAELLRQRRKAEAKVKMEEAARRKAELGAGYVTDEYARELHLAMLLMAACQRRSVFAATYAPNHVPKTAATQPGSLQAMADLMREASKRLSGRASATSAEVADALAAVADGTNIRPVEQRPFWADGP